MSSGQPGFPPDKWTKTASSSMSSDDVLALLNGQTGQNYAAVAFEKECTDGKFLFTRERVVGQ